MSPNAGGGELRGLSQSVQLNTGAQINFGDLTPMVSDISAGDEKPLIFFYSASVGLL